jgi:hypothetical protein
MKHVSQTRIPEYKRPLIEQDREVDYWSKEFGITKNELADAVKAGLTSAEAVEKYVKKIQLQA